MATFTVLTATELNALATEFSLGAIRAFRTIAAGTINSNFAIDTDSGRYFLRVNEGKSEADVAWEARLVGALADRGVTAPKPITGRDGRLYAALPRVRASNAATAESSGVPLMTDGASDSAGADTATKWVSAFPWRAGSHLAADAVTPQHAEHFGRALAALHVAGLDLPTDWRRTSIYDHAHLVDRLARIERERDPALADAVAFLREELDAAAHAATIRRAATHGIIHGDLFRDNVLWDQGRISAILDFEQASGGSLAYDLAVCINDWCWSDRDRAPRMDLATALVAGYHDVRPLDAADRAALPVELRASAARFTITRITDVYLAKVSNPEKDFRAFLARCEAWRTQAVQLLTSLM